MKTMHFGIMYDEDCPIENLSLPPGFQSDGDSFLTWGERMGDSTLHLTYDYETHRLPEAPRERSPENLHPNTSGIPVRGWLRLMGYWDRERAEVARLRLVLAERLIDLPEARLCDYVVLTEKSDWAEDQRIWTIDGILSRCGQ